jgi:hypothetical protein
MPAQTRTSSRLLLILSLPIALCLNALPAQAKSVQEHLDSGYAYADQAVKYEEDHKYATACRFYRDARDELAAAILGTATERGRLDTGAVQEQVNGIMKHMKEICGRDDE